jgi:hypothetical protein
MNHISIYLKQILVIATLVVCFQNEACSQDTLSKTIHSKKSKLIFFQKKPGMYVGLSVGPSQTSIKPDGVPSISKLSSSSKSAFIGSVDVGYFFSNYIGLSSGIGIISYKTQLSLDAYQSNFNTIDSDNDAFEMRVTGTNIKEEQSVNFLSIPLCVDLRLPFSQKVGFYFKGGINMAVPLAQTYTTSGVFTYKGFYPAFNDLLENLPQFGFPTNKVVVGNGDLKLKTAGVSPIFSFGFDYYIQPKIQFSIGVSFANAELKANDAGSTPVVTTDKFQLSPNAEQINSFIGGSNKNTAQSMGVKFAVRYFFKK